MAIYESKGRRVQLEGRDIQRGFRPEVVYDPTSSLSQAANQRIQAAGESGRQYSEQLSQLSKEFDAQGRQSTEALASFSETLSEFLIEKQKKYNENQKNLGIADILNGDIRLNPELYDKYKEKRDYLEKANDTTLQVVEETKKEDPGLAETFYQQAPAVKGWRAYGQAIGKAQMASSQLETFLTAFLKSDEPIQYTNNKGQTETFTPRQIQTQEQLSAAWNVGLKKYIETSGLNQINPVILAEHVTPTVLQVRSELLGRRMNEVINTRTANAKDTLNAELSANAVAMSKDPTKLGQMLQRINKSFIELNGMNRTEGNNDTHEAMKQTIRALAAQDRVAADSLFQKYRGTSINPEKPELGTWGSRFDMTDLGDFLKQTAKTQQDEADEEIKQEAEGIRDAFQANPNSKAFKEALSLLGKLPQTQAVRDITIQLNEDGPNYSPQREQFLLANATSRTALDSLRASGAISAQGYERAKQRFAVEKEYEKLLPERSSIKGSIRAVLVSQANFVAGKTPEDFNNRTALLTDDFSGRIMAYVIGGLKSGRIKQTPEAVNAAIDKLIREDVGAYVAQSETGQPIYLSHPKDARFSSRVLSTVQTADGRTGQQIVNAELARLPANLSSMSQLRLTADRIQDTIDVMSSGGQPPSDISFLARRMGVSVPEVLKQQVKYYPGMQFDINTINKGNQVYLENRKINPVIAEQLRNPRLTDQQRAQLNSDLLRQRQQQEQPPAAPQELKSFKSQVSSVNYENYIPGKSGQPGLDIFFEDKRFPVVMDGVVKDKGYEAGYGNYVVIESTDPETGEQVDVLYGHLASRSPLALNSSVTAGQLVGTQGGTGNVQSADGTIASIDFLAPAPRGSGSMKPYRNYDRLRRRIGAIFGR